MPRPKFLHDTFNNLADAYDEASWDEPPNRIERLKQRNRIMVAKRRRWSTARYDPRWGTIYAGRRGR